MRTKAQHLKAIEEAYHTQGQVVSAVGLYLTPPFAATKESGELAQEIRGDALKLEEKLRDLYRLENAAERP